MRRRRIFRGQASGRVLRGKAREEADEVALGISPGFWRGRSRDGFRLKNEAHDVNALTIALRSPGTDPLGPAAREGSRAARKALGPLDSRFRGNDE